ncbi:hypothetical protein C3V37_06320 [Peptostreptococcaceae bacterium oral taxon 929]|nr:hypothetical protein C3V37_06320 [Peptostreptococcaceae bacterium oral taxon 929]
MQFKKKIMKERLSSEMKSRLRLRMKKRKMARTMTIYNKYILNTIVSLKRNIKGYKYPDMLMWSKLNEILNMVLEALKNTSYSFMLYEVSNMDKEKFEYFLAKGFMDESVKENITRTKLLLDEDKSIAIVINNNDHIEIRVLGTASADELVDIAIDIERELDKSIDFQFDEDYGYLTSDPVNIGNGINIAKIVHLYRRDEFKKDELKSDDMEKIRLTPLIGPDGSKIEDIYILDANINKFTSIESFKKLSMLTDQNIIVYENENRRRYLEQNYILMKDRIMKALEMIKVASLITYDEALIYLSNLMFARSMDLLDPVEASIDAGLYLMITPEAIEYTYSISDKSEIDQKRATILREKLGKIKFIDKDIKEEENKEL